MHDDDQQPAHVGNVVIIDAAELPPAPLTPASISDLHPPTTPTTPLPPMSLSHLQHHLPHHSPHHHNHPHILHHHNSSEMLTSPGGASSCSSSHDSPSLLEESPVSSHHDQSSSSIATQNIQSHEPENRHVEIHIVAASVNNVGNDSNHGSGGRSTPTGGNRRGQGKKTTNSYIFCFNLIN